jgi:hypothetical protein
MSEQDEDPYITLDLETYFDARYSLRNKDLTMDGYIKDERFEMLVLGYAFGEARHEHPGSRNRNRRAAQMTFDGSRDEQFHGRRDEGGPALSPSPCGAGLRRPDCSVTALHESAHCVFGRFYGLPIATVTVVASEHFYGRCFGPLSRLEDGPEDLLACAAAMCAQALAAQCHAPERIASSPLLGSPIAASRVTELVAGFCGERVGGYDGAGEAGSSDLTIATVFAATIAAPSAIGAYLDFCRRSAEAILRDHWPAVLALATELDARGTLDGAEIDRIIEEAEFQVARAAELARRKKMAEMAKSAEKFNAALA